MSIKIRRGNLEIEVTEIDQVVHLLRELDEREKPVDVVRPVFKVDPGMGKIATDEQLPLLPNNGHTAIEVWKRLSRLDRRTINGLCAILDVGSIGIDSTLLAKKLGLKGRKGLSGFSKHTHHMCKALLMLRTDVCYPVKQYSSNTTLWHAGPRAIEFITAVTGLSYDTVLDILTQPKGKD